MQGERTSLVLHQQSIEGIRDVGQPASRDLQPFRAAFVHRPHTAAIPSLQSVLAGDGQRRPAEELVDVLDRSSGDQRERAAGDHVHAMHEIQRGRLDVHRVGRVRELEERAVHVEEIGPPPSG